MLTNTPSQERPILTRRLWANNFWPLGSPTLVFEVLISENDRCIAAELKSHLS